MKGRSCKKEGIATKRHKSHIRIGALSLCICVCVFRPLLAQSRVTFTGVVQDESGAAVAGAKIALMRQISSQTLETTSGEAGRFSFEELSPGEYLLKAVQSL